MLSYVETTAAITRFKHGKPELKGDGFCYLKIDFDEIGQIDVLATINVTDIPPIMREIEGRMIALESVPEIIAKKIRYRGFRIQPRNILDIAAALQSGHADGIRTAIEIIPEYAAKAVACMKSLSEDYVSGSNSRLILRKNNKELVNYAYSITLDFLETILAAHEVTPADGYAGPDTLAILAAHEVTPRIR